MRVNTRVGLLPVGHVFVTPLTRRFGSVAPWPSELRVAVGEERRVQEIDGIRVDLGINKSHGVERKKLHPDVLVEIAVEDVG